MKRILFLAFSISVLCSCTRELLPCGGDSAAAETICHAAVCLEDETSRASFISGDGYRKLAWETSDKFDVFYVADGTTRTVLPESISPDGLTASLPVAIPAGADSADVVITYGDVAVRIQSDSIIYAVAKAPIRQKLCTQGFEFDALPLSSRLVTVKPGSPGVFSLAPLTALVCMTLDGLPASGDDKVISINFKADEIEKGAKCRYIAADGYRYRVMRDGFTIDTSSSLELYDREDYAEFVELKADSPEAVSSGTLQACFRAAGQIQGEDGSIITYIKKATVTIVTESRTIVKTFDFGDADGVRLRTTTGRISSFTLGMSDAKVEDRTGFGVVWSPGYLIYDAAARAYCFAEPDDPGLFFKLGSVCGFDPSSSEDIATKTIKSKYLVYWRKNDETGAIVPTDYDVPWGLGAADLAAYGKDASGNIVPIDVPSYESIDDYVQYSKPAYNYDQDPCKYVADKQYEWRMPSQEECQALQAIVGESVSNWSVHSRGSKVPVSNDGTPHVIVVTDKDGQSVSFASGSYITNSNSVGKSGSTKGLRTFYVQQQSTYSIYFPTRDFATKVASSSKEQQVYAPVVSFQSLNTTAENYEAEVKIITGSYAQNSFSAEGDNTPLSQGATVIRCVRD